MKTFEEILSEVAKENNATGWLEVRGDFLHKGRRNDRYNLILNEAAKRYAKQTAQDALNRAATRATADIQNGKAVIEKSSILTTEIRLV